jgi:hypothetical protein
MSSPTGEGGAAEGSREPSGPGAPPGGIGDEHGQIDPALVRRAQRGDARAPDALVRALEPSLGRICGAVALQAGDDALQEAMIAVIRNIGALREPAAVRAWAALWGEWTA